MKYWTREESKERFPKAITPLGWSLLQVPLETSLAQMSKVLGVKNYRSTDMILWKDYYIYTRKKFFSDFKNLKFNYLHLLKTIFVSITVFFETLLSFFSEKGKFKDRFINRLFYKLFSSQIKNLIDKWPTEIDRLKHIMGRDYGVDNIKLLDFETFHSIKLQMQEDSRHFFAEDFNVYFLKKLIFELLKSQLVSQGIDSIKAEEMVSLQAQGLEGNFSIKMIEDFNDQAISSEELKKKYGHLTDNWDLYSPTLGENENLWKERHFSPIKIQKKTVLNDHEKIEKLLSWNNKTAELINWFQQLVLMDEDLRAYSSLQYPEARKLMKLVEATPAWKELILREDSIYFLSLIEIEHGLKKQDFHPFFDLINPRREAFLAALKTSAPFDLIQNENGTFTIHQIGDLKTKELKGVCVSGGKAEGDVVFVNEYADLSKISKKSILVLESATPVYAPFYTLCGGIISEMGGTLSHGAIVAREYGIPMLSGVEYACEVLKEGQSIILDADQRIVKVKSNE